MYVKTLSAGDDTYAGDEGAPDLVDLVNGGAGNDDLSGGQGDDTLNGQDDNDLLNGGAGNDILDGGAGDDTAAFSGAAGDYVWSGDSHSATITGPDGTDTLIDVEHLKFGSTVIDLPAPNTAPTAPADGDAAANTVSEGAAAGTVVAGLTLASTDPDAGQTLTWSLLDDAGGRFAIDAATGVVTVADGSKLNFETATSHQITAQVSDGTAVASAGFTIQVANIAVGAPADGDAAANTISEAAANGTIVSGLTIAAADPNGGVTYSLVDDAGGRFAINAATGVVTVADASLIDFDAASSHQITVRASDGEGAVDASFTIDVANAPPSVPSDADTTANLVSEDAANGALVGITASAAEPKTGTVSYSLSDDAGGRFAIDAATGAVTVADGSKLNFEAASSHQITVRATDGQGAFSSQTFTIAVANVANGAPQDDNSAANTISEGAVNGDAVQGLSISAPDINGGPLVYSLLDDAGGRFAINATTGVVTVANATLLNFEAATSHQIVVRAASGAESATAAFTIGVLNAAPVTPFDANPAAATVIEAANNGAATGLTVSAPDPHGGTVTYSLTNNAGGRFAINATTGVVTVLNGSLLDHDIQSSHTITAQASDGLLTSSADFVITLIDKIDSYWTGTTAANTYTVTATDVQDWQLDGLAGNDTLTGGAGDDVIIGGAGDDILAGAGGNDTFYVATGEGSDTFDGGAGYDTIKASSDNVTITLKAMTGIEAFALNGFINVNIAGTSAADTLDFTNVTIPWTPTISMGAGADIVYGAAGADNIKGDAGNDDLRGGAGNDILDGGADIDGLSGGDGNDTLIGGAGNDSLSGGNGDDLFLMGVGSGTDWVEGDAGYDTVQASADNTIFSFSMLRAVEVISSGGFANVTLPGTSGADNLDFGGYIFVGTVTITGGAGNDWLFGSASDDSIKGEAGEDWIRGQAGNDTLDGGDALDNLEGGDGADTLIGGAGNDLLYGGNGDDVFLIGLGAGSDTFDGGAGFDEIRATANNVAISFASLSGVESISANGFTGVTIAGSSGADNLNFLGVQLNGMAINAGAGDDVITGTNNADVINGGTGNDTIYGLDGNDVIDGGTGADTLYGGAGDDTFLVATDASAYADNFDGGAGVDTVQATANNTVIGVTGMNGIEVFSSGAFSNFTVGGTSAADNLDFTGKTLLGSVVLNGLAGNDVITGTAGDDTIRGGDGVDTLNGGQGGDRLYGDAGADTLNGGDGADILDGGADVDTLNGGAGDDVMLMSSGTGYDVYNGGDGFDEIRSNGATLIAWSSISGVEKISGGGFANVQIGPQFTGLAWTFDFTSYQLEGIAQISGGLVGDNITGTDGNDVIYGGPGADILNGGYGDDTFTYTGPNGQFDTVDGGGGWNKLVAAAANAVIEVASMTGILEISSGGFSGVSFASSNLADTIDLRNVLVVSGITQFNLNGGADFFWGTDGADVVDGGTGDDFIYTAGGDDIIRVSFNNGVDEIHGGDGYDKIVYGGGGNVNILFNFDGIEEVQGSTISLVNIVGTTGGDFIDMSSIVLKNIHYIDGGAGEDVIHGSAGADTIVGGAGVDELFGGDGDDHFLFGAEDVADVVHGGAGYDTMMSIAAISVSAFDGIEAIAWTGTSGYGVKVFGGDGVNTFDLTNVTVSNVYYFSLQGGDDTFIGSASADYIFSGLGADTLSGGGGADKFAYWSTQEAVGDVIVDFVSGQDKIDVSLIDAVISGSGGDDAFTFLGTGGFTSRQGQLRYEAVSDGVVVQDDTNGDGVADFNIKVLGVSSLSASDFVL